MRSIGQMLCDGRWHRLLARKTKHSLSLKVDGRSYTTNNPYPQSTSAETKDPVYLGGYPGEHLSVRTLTFISTHLSLSPPFSVSPPICLPLHLAVSPPGCLSLHPSNGLHPSVSHSGSEAELPVDHLQVQRLSEECTPGESSPERCSGAKLRPLFLRHHSSLLSSSLASHTGF